MPKVSIQYVVWPPLFSSTAVTLLGMEFTRASQAATGIFIRSSMMASRSCWMSRDLALLHLPCEDAPQMLNKGQGLETCLASPTSVPSGSVARQWSYGRSVLGLSCWNTAPWSSFWREGIMLCLSMSQYMLAFMVPPMNCSSPQTQTMTLPPPSFTVGKTHHLCTPHLVAAAYAGHHLNQISSCGSSNPCPVVCSSSANRLSAFLCISFRRGFLLGRRPCRPVWCSACHMVWALTGWLS